MALIKRTIYDEVPLRIEYTLTKKGKDLQGIIDQMAAFSMKHYPKTVFKDGKQRSYKQVFKKPITVLKLNLKIKFKILKNFFNH